MLSTVTLMGRLGHDPELRYTKGSPAHAVCNLSVAVQPYGQEDPDWWTVTCWDQQAEFAANHLAKGGRVLVIGQPRLEEWEGEDGSRYTRMACTARTLQVIDWAESEEGEHAEEASPQAQAPPANVAARAAGRTAGGRYPAGRTGRPQGQGYRRG